MKNIPEEVFKHVKFGSGAKPKASLKIDNTTYILEPGKNYSVVGKKYTPEDWRSQSINISDIPAKPEEDWDQYWTGEC